VGVRYGLERLPLLSLFPNIGVLGISILLIFTAMHVMQTRYSDENSVRPSVCPSVTRVYSDKTEEKSVQIFYHTKDNLA